MAANRIRSARWRHVESRGRSPASRFPGRSTVQRVARQTPNADYMMDENRSFFSELKRRNVYKVAIAYIVGGWALSQGIAQVFPVFDVPTWAIRTIVLVIVLGFPVAVACAWFFEITPEGLK